MEPSQTMCTNMAYECPVIYGSLMRQTYFSWKKSGNCTAGSWWFGRHTNITFVCWLHCHCTTLQRCLYITTNCVHNMVTPHTFITILRKYSTQRWCSPVVGWRSGELLTVPSKNGSIAVFLLYGYTYHCSYDMYFPPVHCSIRHTHINFDVSHGIAGLNNF